MEKFKLELTKEELETIAQLIDAGLRAQGLSMVKQAAFIISKLEEAEPIKQEMEE